MLYSFVYLSLEAQKRLYPCVSLVWGPDGKRFWSDYEFFYELLWC